MLGSALGKAQVRALAVAISLVAAACGQSAATTPDAGPTCTDGLKNGGESGVDCGGTSSCGPCANGQSCGSGSDCSSGVCVSGSCTAPSCTDGGKDGDETGTDCGGSCGPCTSGQGCAKTSDCQSGVCSGTPAVCQAPSCSDGVKNGGESGVDCGGTSSCPKCGDGKACGQDSDCASPGVCTNGLCVNPTCNDGIQDGNETGTDCGGSCKACTAGSGCVQGSDCQSLVCSGTPPTCQPSSCGDGVKNGGESGIDCGGTSSCIRCGAGLGCTKPSDCASALCGPAGYCVVPTGSSCAHDNECQSGFCGVNGLCAPDSCHDGKVDMGESGVDCGGGSSCGGCPGTACTGNGEGNCGPPYYCSAGVCATNGCRDGVQDDGEEAVDCGGTSVCGQCATETCTGTGQGNCAYGLYCANGVCGSDSCHDGAQDNGEDGVDCGINSQCGGCLTQACAQTGQGNCAPGLFCEQSTHLCGNDPCFDGVQDDGESGLDCGGTSSCGRCLNDACNGTGAGTCIASLFCEQTTHVCGTDSCHDGVQDDGESGVDCGGTSICGRCQGDACSGTGAGNCLTSLYCEQTTHTCGIDPCFDGVQDHGEEAVDCGGTSACGKCQGDTCTGTGAGNCLTSLYCEQTTHTCGTDPCFDGVQDKGESGLDCGGSSACGKCSGDTCTGTGAGNCLTSLYCEQPTHTCGTDPCFDGVQDHGEEAVDCGGSSACGKCSGDTCTGTGFGNCLTSLYCEQNTHTCGTDPCFDGIQDHGEETVDCGGTSACGKCSGDGCTGTGFGNCLSSLYCEQNTLVCGTDPCFDGVKDNGEENTDCGGNTSCGRCSGDACTGTGFGNCLASLYCEQNTHTCGTDPCHDGILDHGEGGIDCGGTSACGSCSGASCTNNGTGQGTCQPGLYCTSGQCGTDSCHDLFTDNGEQGVDCGGTSSCGGCSGANCTGIGHGTCHDTLYCAGGVCGSNSCADGAKDGSEGDIDCGGSCSTKCGLGKGCNVDTDCAIGICSANKVCGLGEGLAALSVASGTAYAVPYTETSATGSAGANTLTVGSTTGFTVTNTSGNALGNVVFIHQTQSKTTTPGVWEINRITSIGSGQFTLSKPLVNNYVSGAQVVTLPQYSTVSIAGTLYASVWNGTVGGILPFTATGAVTVTGAITMIGSGFRGGGSAQGGCVAGRACSGIMGFAGESPTGGIVYSTPDGTSQPTYGTNNGTNNGGGGGGGSYGQDCAEGGGGSYGGMGSVGAAGGSGTCAISGHGGGLPGAIVGVADLTAQLDLGSGGGQGGPDEDGSLAGPGGTGGGAVAIIAQSITVSGVIETDGQAGQGGNNTGNCSGYTGTGGGSGDGNGGGGAGGGIMVVTTGAASIGTNLLHSYAGAGGTNPYCAAGGAGGVGRIQVRSGSLSGSSSPALSQ